MAVTLKLTRNRWVENLSLVGQRPFDITLDGTVVGTVSPRETVELPADAGHHTLRLGAGHRVSPERSFDATDGETIAFACHGPAFWPIYLASFVKPDLGISLKRQ
jgi:hypothetical protein